MSETLYLATEKNVKVTGESVALGEIARLTCADPHVLARAKALKVMRIPAGQYGRYVVTAVTLIELVQRHLENVEVTHLGEAEFLITFEKPGKKSRIWPWIKTLLVCVVTFLGAAFSIMTFNTDVDVPSLFSHIYTHFTGEGSGGIFRSGTVLFHRHRAGGCLLF